ncbi:MAG TPA: type VI secretion system contractile sheath large subunit, partial [Pirellulales bacterium]
MCAQEETKATAAAGSTTESESTLLDTILSQGMRARDDDALQRGKDLLKEFVGQLLDPSIVVAKDTEKTINLRIAEIDRLLSAQLNEIMHHPEFQQLEGSWRGLHYLVDQTETSVNLKIRMLNVTKKDLLKDMERASEFDQSALFKKVYEDEYGMFGGAPYGALIGDYEFGRHPQDIALLERISNVAAAAHAPFLSASSPQLFGWDSFTELSGPRDLAKIFDTVEYAKWKSFRDSEDSRYVGLTLPHTLSRLPYGKETVPVEAFNFEEDVDGRDHQKYLWSNAAYSLGSRITDAFAKYGWMAAIRGVEGGGLVEGLPTH